MTDPSGLDALIADVRASEQSDFYRTLWGSARTFAELPHLTSETLAQTPLSKRAYLAEKSITKIVTRGEQTFPIATALLQLRDMRFGPLGQRPLVFFADTYEGIEKSMWCYLHGRVPVIGEQVNPVVAAAAAREYRITQIIVDTASITKLVSILDEHKALGMCTQITVIDERFSVEQVLKLRDRFGSVTGIFALPETGPLGEVCMSTLADTTVSVHPLSDVVLECGDDGNLITTVARLLVTPMVRYDTGIRVRQVEQACACGRSGHTLVLE